MSNRARRSRGLSQLVLLNADMMMFAAAIGSALVAASWVLAG